MISIYNPTSQSVDLSDYYITDSASGSSGYYNLPSGVTIDWCILGTWILRGCSLNFIT